MLLAAQLYLMHTTQTHGRLASGLGLLSFRNLWKKTSANCGDSSPQIAEYDLRDLRNSNRCSSAANCMAVRDDTVPVLVLIDCTTVSGT